MTDVTTPEPMPTDDAKNRQPVAERLKAMIDERTAMGVRKYGEPLHTHNGRDATMDALQESLDLNQYLMQALMEAEQARETLREVRAAEDLYDLRDSFKTLVEWATEDHCAPDDVQICLSNIAQALDHITKASACAAAEHPTPSTSASASDSPAPPAEVSLDTLRMVTGDQWRFIPDEHGGYLLDAQGRRWRPEAATPSK